MIFVAREAAVVDVVVPVQVVESDDGLLYALVVVQVVCDLWKKYITLTKEIFLMLV